MSGKLKYVVWALVAFVVGAGLAWVQNHYGNVAVPTEQASTDAPATGEQPAVTDTASSGSAVVPDAPARPESAESATAAAATTAAAVTEAAPATTAGLAVGGPFTLTDNKGVTVTEKSWPGKYLLVFFGFSNCPDICPATLQKLTTLMDNYDPTGAKIQPILITVDPARDTPEVLNKYLTAFNSHIVALTGTPEQITAVEKAYKVYATPATASHDHHEAGHEGMNHDAAKTDAPDAAGEKAEQVEHSGFVYLMAPDGTALTVLASDLTAEDMLAKIKPFTDAATPAVIPPAATPDAPVATQPAPATEAPATDAPPAE